MLLQPVDIYCERVLPAFFNEPYNVLSNLAFLLAAVLLWNQYQKLALKNISVKWLICLVGIIAFGSAGFHLFANTLSMMGDIIPILAFLGLYLATFMRDIMRCSKQTTAGVVVLFLGSVIVIPSVFPPAYQFNGSCLYLPVLLMLLFLTFYSMRKNYSVSRLYLLAAITFIISLTFRTFDASTCDEWPIGTHFIWHMLNATALYACVRALMHVTKTQEA